MSNYALMHGQLVREDELYHWKYIDKIKTAAGKWRYIYDKTVDGISDAINDVKNAFDSKKNKYDVTSKNYAEKTKALAKDPEWKKIVEKKDPEYVKTDSEGNTKYDIDSYLVNKKFPVLDAVNDMAAGRKVSTFKMDADTTVAAVKDIGRMVIRTGQTYLGIASRLLTERIKMGQGSYDDEIKNVKDNVSKVAKAVTSGADTAKAEYKKYATSTAKASVEAEVKKYADSSGSVTVEAAYDFYRSPEGQKMVKEGAVYLDRVMTNYGR